MDKQEVLLREKDRQIAEASDLFNTFRQDMSAEFAQTEKELKKTYDCITHHGWHREDLKDSLGELQEWRQVVVGQITSMRDRLCRCSDLSSYAEAPEATSEVEEVLPPADQSNQSEGGLEYVQNASPIDAPAEEAPEEGRFVSFGIDPDMADREVVDLTIESTPTPAPVACCERANLPLPVRPPVPVSVRCLQRCIRSKGLILSQPLPSTPRPTGSGPQRSRRQTGRITAQSFPFPYINSG